MTNPASPVDSPAPVPVQKRRRTARRVGAALALAVGIPIALFVINGAVLSKGETPRLHILSREPSRTGDDLSPPTVKILAFNIAKCFVFKDGEGIESVQAVKERIGRIAELINAENPDFVFLSETVVECGPCPVNQVALLAEATGMHAWAFGENYNFGLPVFRVVGGNAILSRRPLEVVGNPSLAGRRPFYATKNNRRVLWCAAQIGGRRVLLAAIHTDSFDRENNRRQTGQILDFVGDREAVLAGDFNALPEWPSIDLVRQSGRFRGKSDGPKTFPSDRPDRRLDYIFAPAGWELLDERVLASDVSDHRAIVATFRMNR
jgi:endonuclease/exonuclease/phosphatase family metal-dependent hydrolase